MKLIIVTGQWLGLLLVFLTANAFSAEPTQDSLETVHQNVNKNKAILVDVREKSEWETGQIKGSVLIPLSELKAGIDSESLAKKLPSEKIVYTFCVKGVRSCTAADFLKKQGYEVRPLKPGYRDLLNTGFEQVGQ